MEKEKKKKKKETTKRAHKQAAAKRIRKTAWEKWAQGNKRFNLRATFCPGFSPTKPCGRRADEVCLCFGVIYRGPRPAWAPAHRLICSRIKMYRVCLCSSRNAGASLAFMSSVFLRVCACVHFEFDRLNGKINIKFSLNFHSLIQAGHVHRYNHKKVIDWMCLNNLSPIGVADMRETTQHNTHTCMCKNVHLLDSLRLQ